MPSIADAFPSKYVKAGDLHGSEKIVTIKGVKTEEVGRGRERKLVVYFKGAEKGLVLNKTNATRIAKLVGSEDTDDWTGKQVKLFATETEFGGETVDCIRIKSASAKPEPQDGDADDDADIPF